MCKTIRTGDTEILICRTKNQWEFTEIINADIGDFPRFLRGILVKDKSNKDVLICEEVKTNEIRKSKEEQEQEMKEMLRKARALSNHAPMEVVISNKLVCFENSRQDADVKELKCQMMQVKELVVGEMSSLKKTNETTLSKGDSEICTNNH